jgi:hypothetical protein
MGIFGAVYLSDSDLHADGTGWGQVDDCLRIIISLAHSSTHLVRDVMCICLLTSLSTIEGTF